MHHPTGHRSFLLLFFKKEVLSSFMLPTALIFDVDGTLAETEELHRQAFNETFAQAGLGWVWTEALYADLLSVTGGKERIRHYLALLERPPGFGRRGTWPRCTPTRPARYTRHGRSPAWLRPAPRRRRHARRRRRSRAHASPSPPPPAARTWTPCCAPPSAQDPFEVIAAGDEVAAKKPAPDVYRAGADSRLGAAAAATAWRSRTRQAGLRSARKPRGLALRRDPRPV